MQIEGSLAGLDVDFQDDEGLLLPYWLASGTLASGGVTVEAAYVDRAWLSTAIGALFPVHFNGVCAVSQFRAARAGPSV